jgi:hypothetical protein
MPENAAAGCISGAVIFKPNTNKEELQNMEILHRNKIFSTNSAFTATHQQCPCGQHRGCYALRNDNSGYCFSCGKNFPANDRERRAVPTSPPKPAAPRLYALNENQIFPSVFGVPKSPFCRTCERITGFRPEAHYYIGAFGNDVVFWYRDFARVVRQKKTVRFHTNGFNRRKDVPPHTIKGAFTPFWGEEHLQKFVNTPLSDVFIVESEKTAIYCQFTHRWALWLACGGANGCTRAKIERVQHLLSEKRVFVLFDHDEGGRNGAKTAIANFGRCGIRATALSVSDLFPNAPAGVDLADAIVAGKGGL